MITFQNSGTCLHTCFWRTRRFSNAIHHDLAAKTGVSRTLAIVDGCCPVFLLVVCMAFVEVVLNVTGVAAIKNVDHIALYHFGSMSVDSWCL